MVRLCGKRTWVVPIVRLHFCSCDGSDDGGRVLAMQTRWGTVKWGAMLFLRDAFTAPVHRTGQG